MNKFKPGDQVIVNRGILATIQSYEEKSNRVVYVVGVSGGTNTVYAHISNTDLAPVPKLPVELAKAITPGPKVTAKAKVTE